MSIAKNPRFLFVLAFAMAPCANAAENQACSDDTVVTVARWVGISAQRIADRATNRLVTASACKVMPNAPGTTISVVAFDISRNQAPDDGIWTQAIVLVENGKVVAGDRSIIGEDADTAVGDNSYRIDTAPYRLSPTVRAFGVVFWSAARGASCPDVPAGNELL